MLVRLILEYACVAWSPYHQCNVHAIEMVQRHAARYALSKFDRYASVSDMISLLGWPILESRRNKLRRLMMHNNLVDVSTNTILLPSTRTYGEITTITLQSQYLYLFPQAIKLWNSLLQHLISSPDF